MINIQKLNALTLPLIGECLIEASAGTGKTFTIVALYLRLLLGINNTKIYRPPLSVEKILVVTFTNLAAEELRTRIRSNIHALCIACIHGKSNNALLSELLQLIHNKNDAINKLLTAERQIDQAAIYTIHSFCQRMLSYNVLESGVLFHQIFVQNELPLYRQACADFWRRCCYSLPLNIAAIIRQEWHEPNQLLIDLQPYLHGVLPEIYQLNFDNTTLEQKHQENIKRIDTVKSLWREVMGNIKCLIMDSGVDPRIYNSHSISKWLISINNWVTTKTHNYQLPKEIKRFKQNTLIKNTKNKLAPYNKLFTAIEQLFIEPLSLRNLFLSQALKAVRANIQKEKKYNGQIGFNDLPQYLYEALHQPNNHILCKAIYRLYPVAMIDEFQDTDRQQYNILQKIYSQSSKGALFLIGDPKQAIYSFRGADVFTYMHVRNKMKCYYTLDINWRSSPGIVAAVNKIFSTIKNPFIFIDIPFIPVISIKDNQKLCFKIEGNIQEAIHIWLKPGKGFSGIEYRQSLATKCAIQIRDWLTAGQKGTALLYTKKKDLHGNNITKVVEASDITILVRTNVEATLMHNALKELAIPSVYLSNHDSIFQTSEANDLFLLLQAILSPQEAHLLRSALATRLFGCNAQQIHDLNYDENQWGKLITEFTMYRQQWITYGILPMLHKIMAHRKITENLLASQSGERCLTNVLHIGELLQEASFTVHSAEALLHWLAKKIDNLDIHSDNEQLRLENDNSLVKIMTIHKSKGLEFPIVCLPFIGSYRVQKNILYHDRNNFNIIINLNNTHDVVQLAEEERLAEDIRLLYVALTRSIYHCSIGLAPLFVGNRKKQGNTDMHLCAIGYLVQQGKAGDSVMLLKCLKLLEDKNIKIINIYDQYRSPWVPPIQDKKNLKNKTCTRNIQDDWRITSYSGLQHQSSVQPVYLSPKVDKNFYRNLEEFSLTDFTSHTFPTGIKSGIFLHRLLELLDFTRAINITWLTEQVIQAGLNINWVSVLKYWLESIIHAPLAEQGPCLANIPPNHMLSELQFYLSIDELISSTALDALIKYYDPLSSECLSLNFKQVRGMLKGFIDVVFYWQQRYYILDYKSNWLGKDYTFYTQKIIRSTMIEHRYDFQYQLYSLALHRYLRQRLYNYQYDQHFGGVFYCFLRGITREQPLNGIFYCRPAAILIESIDKLFGYKKKL
ncbi:RecBCD enzyme subunit RecB [Candidatus Profftia lariciata]|uniref:exodeoxyribonuclease V subunit beta n=1 Tax=Candidatus Profftia lariciata TaxID=1987921 RepID=UPI001D00AA49|nr:exodeoxyribonuclease V subunit beta [Candidatus Profftia lariciata]UDG81428.1 RecBCD enzyme subunit RecB [Candidatus Profftia lariciata]